MKHMVKAALAAGLVLAIAPRLARSADHQDSPSVKTDPSSDIADLYSWMDGSNVVFALTVYPDAPATALFSDKIQYVIHTTRSAKFQDPATAKDIMCTFAGAAPQNAQCWVGDDAFVQGKADAAAGITSKNGKLKVFAGRRKDPFFFNLDGFKNAVATIVAAENVLTFDTSGCPSIDPSNATALRGFLSHSSSGGAPVDHFKSLAALAIVVSVDKSLLVSDDAPILSAWASTNKAQ